MLSSSFWLRPRAGWIGLPDRPIAAAAGCRRLHAHLLLLLLLLPQLLLLHLLLLEHLLLPFQHEVLLLLPLHLHLHLCVPMLRLLQPTEEVVPALSGSGTMLWPAVRWLIRIRRPRTASENSIRAR